MSDAAGKDPIAIALFSEIATVDHLMRARLSRALPRGMEISHFTLLDYLVRVQAERTPAQLARIFHVTKGAMTNTIHKLERTGYLHIRPDWDDARRKMVTISPAGVHAHELAVQSVAPVFDEALREMGLEDVRSALPLLRRLRGALASGS